VKRDLTNIIRYFLDEWMPPIIRDSRWFMYPLFWYWFKGRNISLYMNFKKEAWKMSEQEFTDCYRKLDCRATDRPSDLNKKSLNLILEKLNKESSSLIDVGCGRGFWLSLLKNSTNLTLSGCDIFDSFELDGVDYKRGSIESLPYPDKSFDIVTCLHTIEHIRDIKKAIEELKRVAKKQIIIVTPRQRYYYFTLDLHLHFFPEKEYLIELIGLPENECITCDGDWCYFAKP